MLDTGSLLDRLSSVTRTPNYTENSKPAFKETPVQRNARVTGHLIFMDALTQKNQERLSFGVEPETLILFGLWEICAQEIRERKLKFDHPNDSNQAVNNQLAIQLFSPILELINPELNNGLIRQCLSAPNKSYISALAYSLSHQPTEVSQIPQEHFRLGICLRHAYSPDSKLKAPTPADIVAADPKTHLDPLTFYKNDERK